MDERGFTKGQEIGHERESRVQNGFKCWGPITGRVSCHLQRWKGGVGSDVAEDQLSFRHLIFEMPIRLPNGAME